MRKLIYLLCLLPLGTVAQPALNFSFTNISVNDGLSQNSAYSIMQDKQGFIWIGTGDGLNRYDGRNFKIFRSKENDTSGKFLPGSIINSNILEDANDRLWFNTNVGLISFDKKTETFKINRISGMPFDGNAIMPVGIDDKGILWGAISRVGIIAFNTSDLKATLYPIKDCPAYDQNRFMMKEGRFWAITNNAFVHLNLYSGIAETYLQGTFSSLATCGDGGIVVGGRNEIICLDERSKKASRIPTSALGKEMYWTKLTGRADKVYAVSRKGEIAVFSLTGQREHRVQHLDLETRNLVTVLFADLSQNLWIGTDGFGIEKADFKPRKFSSYPRAGMGGNLMVKALFLNDDDNLLIGTYNAGIISYNLKTHQTKRINLLQGKTGIQEPVFFIKKDSSGRIWTNSGGTVGYLDPATLLFRKTFSLPAQKLSAANVHSVYTFFEHKKNHFLLGTNSGLYEVKIVDGEQIVLGSVQTRHFGNVYEIQKGPDGTLYLGRARGGFWRLRYGESEFNIIDSAFIGKGVRHFYFSKNKNIVWIATDEGLAAYNPRTMTYQVFDESHGMSNHYVYGILAESDESLWLSTNKGLNHATVAYHGDASVRHVKFNSYTYKDGLQSNEFNSGAFIKSAAGQFFFGGIHGVTWFKPDSVIKNTYAPKPALIALKVNDAALEGQLSPNYITHISLPHRKNNLQFEFAALEFTNPGANKFQYIMEGIDHSWTDAGTNNLVKYANLPPGNYRLKLKVSNNDGVWSNQLSELSITIVPPVWATWWFRLLLLLLILLLTAAVTKIIAQRRLKGQIELLQYERAINRERERISREMHDEIGAGLTQITLMSESVKRRLKQPESSKVSEIAKTGRNLIGTINEIIWSMKSETSSIDALLSYLREKLDRLLEYSGIEYSIHFPEKPYPIKLSNEQRRNTLMTTTEIVNNCIKHSKAKNLHIRAVISDGLLVFEVEDDGKGFEIGAKRSGSGLSNIEKRIGEIDGTIEISSIPGSGARFRYAIPLPQNSHLQVDQ